LQLIDHAKEASSSEHLYQHLTVEMHGKSTLVALLDHIKQVSDQMGRALHATVEAVVSDHLARMLTFLEHHSEQMKAFFVSQHMREVGRKNCGLHPKLNDLIHPVWS
jgi:hypothetical protein